MITNKINARIYIGKTTDFKRRLNEHKNRKPIKSNNYIMTSMIEYHGFDTFEFTCIDTAETLDELNYKEHHYISLYQSNLPEFGYNSKSGGVGGSMNERTRQLMSESHRGLRESSSTKIKKSNTVVAFLDNECFITDSAKLFGDSINMSKDKVKNALRMPCRIINHYIFYMNKEKRNEIKKKTTNHEYIKLCRLLDKGVEAIEKLYNITYIKYN